MDVWRRWYVFLGIAALGFTAALAHDWPNHTVSPVAAGILLLSSPCLFIGGVCGMGNLMEWMEAQRARSRRIRNARAGRRLASTIETTVINYRGPDVTIVTQFKCPVCKEWHDTESAARWCAEIDTAGG